MNDLEKNVGWWTIRSRTVRASEAEWADVPAAISAGSASLKMMLWGWGACHLEAITHLSTHHFCLIPPTDLSILGHLPASASFSLLAPVAIRIPKGIRPWLGAQWALSLAEWRKLLGWAASMCKGRQPFPSFCWKLPPQSFANFSYKLSQWSWWPLCGHYHMMIVHILLSETWTSISYVIHCLQLHVAFNICWYLTYGSVSVRWQWRHTKDCIFLYLYYLHSSYVM